jgi:hypothetical protein
MVGLEKSRAGMDGLIRTPGDCYLGDCYLAPLPAPMPPGSCTLALPAADRAHLWNAAVDVVLAAQLHLASLWPRVRHPPHASHQIRRMWYRNEGKGRGTKCCGVRTVPRNRRRSGGHGGASPAALPRRPSSSYLLPLAANHITTAYLCGTMGSAHIWFF